MGKSNSPMRVFTPAWHETGCRINKDVKAYEAFWKEHHDQLPTAFKDCGLGWHDTELEAVKFVEVHGGREDMYLTMSYRSMDSFFRDTLIFRNAQVHKHNVDVGNVWLYDEVELLPDGRYYIRIMFYAGGDKRRYIKVICDDVIAE